MRRISNRRWALFATIALLLCAVAWMQWIGAAAISGTSFQDMDWNEDGQVTRGEILQSAHAVIVVRSTDGARTCTEFRWRRDQSVIRVDCRTGPADD
ncbi:MULTISPECIES: hypothetical protein [Luteimonas]|uniref:hypothetical protein n=1 Tax=Luteimonas TaxID=83614 RepID=UPI000C7DC8DE|nr:MULTISPECIES: hypothetical protein [Luteimonas]